MYGDLLCSYIGSTWRTFFKQGATHKLHLLESHAPLQLRSFRVLVIFLHSNNKQNRLFCNLKNYAKLEQHKIKINASAQSSEVKDLITRVISSSTRVFCDHVQLTRSAKLDYNTKIKSEKRKEFLVGVYDK